MAAVCRYHGDVDPTDVYFDSNGQLEPGWLRHKAPNVGRCVDVDPSLVRHRIRHAAALNRYVLLSPFQVRTAWVAAYTMLLNLVVELGVTILLSRQVVDVGSGGVA